MEDNKISRRDALKRMGLFAAGLAVTSIGVPGLSSCSTERGKKRIIFYFTGTGNCLYISRMLAEQTKEEETEGKVETELLSIPQMVKEGRYDFEADEIGIVYPIYGHMPPNMVRNFVKKASLKADYKFAILTYGARHANAVGIWDEITRKAGTPFDYIATLIMVDNWLPSFDMNEQMKMDKHIPENLQKIKADLASQLHWHEPFTEEMVRMHEGFMQFTGLDPEVGFLGKSETIFKITSACVSCGICVDVCPKGNYTIGGNGISTSGDCEYCFACIQNCPQKAIKFGDNALFGPMPIRERNPEARYRNENISIMDIKRANKQ